LRIKNLQKNVLPLKNKTILAKQHSARTRHAFSRLVSVMSFFSILMIPLSAQASVFPLFGQSAEAETIPSATVSSTKTTLSAPSIGPSTVANGSKKQVADVVVSGQALTPLVGPVGTAVDVADLPDVGKTTTYTVHAGDTIGSVALMFGLTKATIMVANDLAPGEKLKPGDTLVILPMSGQQYVVRKGDTLASIARKYKTDAGDLAFFNDIASDADLIAGDTILIPDPDFDTLPQAPLPKKPASNGTITGTSTYAPSFRDPTKPDLGNLILRPVPLSVSVRTQGAHGWNRSAVDIGAPIGTPIRAGYDAVATVATEVGYNGGYGKYVVLDAEIEGKQVRMIYGHMSRVLIAPGQTVTRGQVIGLVGSTGHSTGPHVHWEVRGALNPMTVNPKYTGE
jgi:LysM repeat protein